MTRPFVTRRASGWGAVAGAERALHQHAINPASGWSAAILLFHGYCSLRVDLTQGAGHGWLMIAGRRLQSFIPYGADRGASAMTAKGQEDQSLRQGRTAALGFGKETAVTRAISGRSQADLRDLTAYRRAP
jgi:hypothetical protein